jgi:hypothetical protein
MVDVFQKLGHLKKLISVHYAGKPDTAMSCPSGLEEAGRKRTSVMRLRAALPSYTKLERRSSTQNYKFVTLYFVDYASEQNKQELSQG